MAYGTLTFYSNVMGQDMEVNVLLPDTRRRCRQWHDWRDEELPVIWVLHGNGDSANAWVRKSVIELYTRKTNAAVIMPSCGRECYADSARGLAYFTYVTEELPLVMRNYFPLSQRRADNVIMGNSMGGYGALKCALTYPDRFRAVASLSGALDYRRPLAGERTFYGGNARAVFGSLEAYEDSPCDLSRLIRELPSRLGGADLDIYQCCGMSDPLFEVNQAYRALFEQYVAPDHYQFHAASGDHDWFYWNSELERIFALFAFPEPSEWAAHAAATAQVQHEVQHMKKDLLFGVKGLARDFR